jgi:hypothetical protein
MSPDTTEKRAALQNPETLATVINAIVRRQYDDQAYDWDPTTVVLELRDDFKAEIPSQVIDRWCAIQVVMTSNAFFQKIDAFLNICNTLSSGAPLFQVFDPVDTEEAAWGLTEVALNREMLPLSNTVENYLRTLLKNDGYEEQDYPQIFKEVLLHDHKGELTTTIPNGNNVEQYIDAQLKSIMHQFSKIPSLKSNELILARSMEEFVGPTA